ncbi:TonB-dependent receptor [Sphingomonas melonis TY]|uniref:TonB-dependent receptor n=3 Tax=Sphingomonas TaxID=13687 RepID=A0A175Y5W8_9SPHN|nr:MULTISPECIES: TonB-dependent receptor [Sphingomonas]AOW24743.1 TonB-dependent receptor [Sphingomonas melonis TY]KZB95825.1 TonB-dependent receptor [Sphingomonas melonis TY]MBQ8102476.1 TonB-dependent receptor [Afipia sp.]
MNTALRVLLLVSAASPVCVSAQTAPSSVADAPTPADQTGNDITVTARRREESVQDVPIAVSVLTDSVIAKSGSQNVSQLVQLQPSLTYYGTNSRNAAINIRGLGAPLGLTNDGLEQGVGIYIDQVYYSRIATAVSDLFDVAGVEVLRGPQGTLYGKNTTAGAINVGIRKPSFTPEAYLEASLGNLELRQAKGAVSGPLTENLAARFAFSTTSRRGTIYNVATRRWINERDNLSLRGQLLWRASDDLDLRLVGDYSRQRPEAGAQIYVRTGATQRSLNRQYAALAAAFDYAPPSTNAFDRLTDLDAELKAGQDSAGISLIADWKLGSGTLTSIIAWRLWNWLPSSDRDFTGLPITTFSGNPSRHRQVTQEVRYAYDGERFDFVAGGFYFWQRFRTEGAQEQGSAASRWLLNPGNVPAGSSGCNPPAANACNPAILDGLRSENDIRYKSVSAAIFGQLTWKVSDRLRILPGVRLNYDKKDGAYSATVTTGSGSTTLNSDQRNTLPPQSYAEKFDSWNLAYDLTVSYDVAREVMSYATFAHGFKSAGINMNGLPLSNGAPVLNAVTVRPEKIDHFEIGLKSQFFDRRATLNLSAFWTEIKDYQTTVTNNQSGGVVLAYLANAVKVRTRGAEAEFSFRPSDRFSLYANGAFTDARYIRFPDAPCPPELSGGTVLPVYANGNIVGTPSAPGTPGGFSPPFCDASGSWLPGVSKWSASYAFEYTLPVSTAGNAYFGFDGTARSKFSSNATRSRYTDVDGYSVENVRLGFRTADDRLNIFGWVRNLFDHDYYELLALQSGNTGLVAGQPADPRTYGITATVRF